MLAGWRNVNATHVVSAALNQLLNLAGDAPDVVFVEPVLRDEDVQLIESRLFAKLDQRGEIDVAVNDVLHARLRLAHVVHTAADDERLFDPVHSLDRDCIADVCFHNLKRIALDQYLAGGGRPRAAFRHKLADANVAVVLDDKQDQVAPLHWSSFDLSTDRASRLSVTHFRILQDRFDEIFVDRVNTQNG